MVFLSTHIEIAASPEKVRDVVCIFLFQKQIMILILLNSSHTLSNYLSHLPLPFSSHPTHQSINPNSSSSSTFPISPPGQSPKVPIKLLELARLKLQKQAQKERLQAILFNPVMS